MHFGNLGTTISTIIDVSEHSDLVQFSIPARSDKRPVTQDIVAYSKDRTSAHDLVLLLSKNTVIRVAPPSKKHIPSLVLLLDNKMMCLHMKMQECFVLIGSMCL